MTRKEFEKFKKKTIRNTTLTVLICVIGCIVPAIILKGMADYLGKIKSSMPASYMVFGIVSVVLLALMVFISIRVVRGARRKLREEKQKVNWDEEPEEEAEEVKDSEAEEEDKVGDGK